MGIALNTDLENLADLDYCYLTTTGRVTGREHTIEIWFALHERTLYLLAGSGENADWVKNSRHTPAVRIRLGDREVAATARVVTDAAEDALARRLVVSKYQPRSSDDLAEWGRTALPVAFELAAV